MSSRAHTEAPRIRLWAALLAVFALVIPTYGATNAAWGDGDAGQCEDSIPVAGYVSSTDSTIDNTPYSIVANTQLFPSQLRLDPSMSRSFNVSISGTDNATVKDVSNMPMHNDQVAPLGLMQDAYNYKYYKFGGETVDGWMAVDQGKTPEEMAAAGKPVVDVWMVGFGDENATKGHEPDANAVEESFNAARQSTITVDYGQIGTYHFNDERGTVPVRMQLVIDNIVPETGTEVRNGRESWGNSNPVFQFATDPSYGVYFYNVHSADFDMVLTNAETGEPLMVDDIYLTQSSLSYWQNGAVQISEMSKPLADVKQVYYSENSNISTTTGESFRAEFDGGLHYESDGDDGFFVPWAGEDQSGNHYTDTVGNQEFPRNAVTFKYVDTSHMRFRNATSSNTMWFTLYPEALTNQAPPAPVKSAYTEPSKGVYAQGEELPEGSVRPGSDIEFVVDQEVNKLGISSLVRYQDFALTDTVPSEVSISEYDVVDENDNSMAEHGTWTSTGANNTYTFEFNRDWLMAMSGGMPLNGEHYYLKLKGTVSDNAAGAFENTAESIINEIVLDNGCIYNHFASNVTEMKAAEPNSTLELTNRGDSFTFAVSARVPEDATTATITDELANVLAVESASIDGKAAYDVAINGTKVTAVTADATADRGADVTLMITAKIREDVTDAELAEFIKETDGKAHVPNTAQVAFDDNPKSTNEVEVIPPPGPSIEKQVTTSKTAINNKHGDLAAIDEVYTYTINTAMPENAKGFKVTDTIDDVLAFASAAKDVQVTLGGEAAGSAAIAGQTLTVTFSEEEVAVNAGKDIQVVFQAKIKVTDAVLVAKYADRTVPNKAQYTITNLKGEDLEPTDSNEVTVTPPPTPREDPEKFVEGQKAGTDDAAEANPLKLDKRSDEFTYTVSQKIPVNAATAEFTDTLVEELEIVGTPTIDGKAAYDVKVTGQTVTATSTDVTDDWGQTVTLTIKAKIRADVSDADLIEKYGSAREIPNTADVAIDGGGKATNEVKVVPPPTPREDPEKFVNNVKNTKDEPLELAKRGDEFTYTVTQVIPADAATAEFTDTLENVLDIVSASIDIEGVEPVIAGQTVTATASGEALKAKWGQKVTLTIKAKIKAGVSDAQLIKKYGSARAIPNTAEVKINNEGKATNTVYVTPPPTPRADPEKFVGLSSEDQQKAGTDKDAKVEPLKLAARDTEFTYTVTQVIPAKAKEATFTDTLVDELEIVGTPTIDGAATYEVKVTGQTVTATSADVTADWGQKVTLTIKAKIRADVKDADLLAKYGTEGSINIPNTADVAIDDDAKTTNEVLVTPPNGSVRVQHVTEDGEVLKDWKFVQRDVPGGTEYTTSEETFPGYEFVKLDEDSAPATGEVVSGTTLDVIYVYKPIETDPEKAVNGSTEKVTLQTRPEEFIYTVSRVIPGGVTDIVFTDTLEDVLEIVGTPTIDAAGFAMDVAGQKVTATLTGDAKALAGQKVTLTIHAKIRDDVTNAQLIERYGSLDVPNEATVSIDGDGKVTNKVLVTPPPPTRGEDLIPFYVAVSKSMGVTVATELEGAKLQITNAETGEVWAEWTSGAEAWYNYIAPGTWVLSEVAAPAGFDVAPPITFTVNADGTVSGESEFISADANSVTMIDPPNSPQIAKTVNKAAHADLASAEEVFTYDISSFVTGDAVSLKVTDTIVDELEFATAANAVKVSVNGTDVPADVAISGQTLTVTLADVAAYRGSFVDVSFTARIRAGADCSKYEVDGTVLVPNTASYTITNAAGEEITTESNTVTVTPPVKKPGEDPSPNPPANPNPGSPTVTKPLVKTGAGVGLSLAMVALLLAGGGSLLALRRREG